MSSEPSDTGAVPPPVQMRAPMRAPVREPVYCPICGRERATWPKTHIPTLHIRQRPDGAHACYGVADLSDDQWAPTAQGLVWLADWQRAHPTEAAELDAWADAAVDHAIARKRAREQAQAMRATPEPPDAA